MIRRLRAALAAICTLMTGAVLIALMLAVATVSEREYRALSQTVFQRHVAQITARLLSDQVLPIGWLAQREAADRLIISIEDNGVPLFFAGGWQPPTPRGALVRMAGEYGAPEGETFLLAGAQGDAYRCSVTQVRLPKGTCQLTVLGDRRAEDGQVRYQYAVSRWICAAGVLLLAGASWLLAGIAVRPVRRGIERQNAFLAAASHELRSPLAAMNACASAILIERDRAAEYVRNITGECDRLGRLVNDLLLLASAGTTSWRIEHGSVALDTMLIETVEQLQPLARAQGHALTLELPGGEELPAVEGDEGRLRQAVRNLILNAIRYSGGGCPIAVRGRYTGRQVQLEVADRGKGIPDADKAHVFERFYRADRSRSDKAHFGLGLSIAWEIVRLHGGKLELRDTPGGGCTFVILLPAGKARRHDG